MQSVIRAALIAQRDQLRAELAAAQVLAESAYQFHRQQETDKSVSMEVFDSTYTMYCIQNGYAFEVSDILTDLDGILAAYGITD